MTSELEMPPYELSKLKDKIMTKEVEEYNNLSELKTLLESYKLSKQESTENFVEILIMLTEELAKITNDHILNQFMDEIKKYINEGSKSIINSLIKICYELNNGEYRKKILIGDDDFFLNNNLDDVSEGDSAAINTIFKFKTFWSKLNEENKNIIKSTLIAVISLIDTCYLLYKKYLCLKQLNTSESKAKLLLSYENYFV